MLTPAQDLAGVADAESDHVADAVREEERLRAALDQALRLAAQQSELDQALGDDQRRRAVHVAPLGTGGAALESRAERRRDDRVELPLLRRELARGRIRAGDVAGVAAVLGAGVDQDQLAVGEPRDVGGKWSTAEFGPLPTIVSNARKSAPLRKKAASSSICSSRSLRPGSISGATGGKAGARRALRGAHPGQLDARPSGGGRGSSA